MAWGEGRAVGTGAAGRVATSVRGHLRSPPIQHLNWSPLPSPPEPAARPAPRRPPPAAPSPGLAGPVQQQGPQMAQQRQHRWARRWGSRQHRQPRRHRSQRWSLPQHPWPRLPQGRLPRQPPPVRERAPSQRHWVPPPLPLQPPVSSCQRPRSPPRTCRQGGREREGRNSREWARKGSRETRACRRSSLLAHGPPHVHVRRLLAALQWGGRRGRGLHAADRVTFAREAVRPP